MINPKLEHGHVRQMFGGRVIRFKCDEDAVMSGSSQVHCDGKSWSSSRPQCFGKFMKILIKI